MEKKSIIMIAEEIPNILFPWDHKENYPSFLYKSRDGQLKFLLSMWLFKSTACRNRITKTDIVCVTLYVEDFFKILLDIPNSYICFVLLFKLFFCCSFE